VAPPELEAVLLSHPQIIDAAVIGVSVPGADGELPRAYVVRRPGPEEAKLTEEDVKNYLAGRLAKYKALTGGVKFTDSIAKNASGKILKRVLREESKKELANGEITAKL
jgi:acyl-coenzyme A synthetase/AMP-(fatty) acid ligase